MKTRTLTKIIAFVMAVSMMVLCMPVGIAAASTQWQISSKTRIYWVKTADSSNTNEALAEQIQLFDSELKAIGVYDEVLPIVYGERADAGANDIVLVLDSTLTAIPAQGYKVEITANQVTISASDDDGLFYGCRYLMQKLKLGSGLDIGSAVTDSPDVAERALSLDCGRKYYTVDWIKELIKEMSWSNMNALVLHFSEEMGLGLESKTYPWLAGRDGTLCVAEDVETDNRYLTQDELRDIAETAALYHVELIPSFDSPGHLNYIVKTFNEHYAEHQDEFKSIFGVEYSTLDKYGIGNHYYVKGMISDNAIVQGSRNTNYSRGIDISEPVARKFIKSLITEYANLFKEFGCTKFDIGGDELLGWGSSITGGEKWKQLDHWEAYAEERSGKTSAVAYDAFLLYMNDLYDLVTGLGYTSVRMWNDDALRYKDTGWSIANGVVQLNKNIEILYWQPSSIDTYLDAGHKVYNYLNAYNYYVLTTNALAGSTYPKVTQESIYTEWSPYVFAADTSAITSDTDKVSGGAFCIWCDNPTLRTEDQVITDILPLIRANGAKAWDAYANDKVSYSTFTANLSTIGNVPSGLPAASEIIDITALKTAVNEYYNSDLTGYTSASVAAYTSAVKSAETLLSNGVYTKNEVDNALAAITAAKAALTIKSSVNAADLEAAIAEYKNMDSSKYTEASFNVYTTAVTAAETLLSGTDYTQDDVDAALEDIKTAKAQLWSEENVSDEECYISAKFKSTLVVRNRYQIMVIAADRAVSDFKVYDDLGNLIEYTISSVNDALTSEGKIYTQIKFKVTTRGTRKYSVYAVYEDGTISPNCAKCSTKCI